MVYGEQKIENAWYYFDKWNGAMQTGFYQLPGKTVYYDPENGMMLYGEQQIGNKWYYFDTWNGQMK